MISILIALNSILIALNSILIALNSILIALNSILIALSTALAIVVGGLPGQDCLTKPEPTGASYLTALENGRKANEGFKRCRHYVAGWLALADEETGLIPRSLRDAYWNAKDSAADNYPFMVLTAAIVDRPLFEGAMRDMLRTEIALTSRIDSLPDTYSFAKKEFHDEKPDLGRILFGASEYIKDGLLPLTEWLGASPWCDRMVSILDDMWKHAPVETPFGRIVSTNVEINGEMLQTLSRVYWMTGEEKYLDWAVRLGDYYLLGENHPTRDFKNLRLRDHGCEIVSGLCELYAAVHFARPEKKKAYVEPIHIMLDRILEIGRNDHGLFYNSVDPRNLKPGKGVADTWGYTLNGFYTVYMIDKTDHYRAACLKALDCLFENYRNYKWEGNSSDGYADSIESALNLYNRERVPSAAKWIDSETAVMWAKQKDDGVIEGWHGDGNFARTTIMYCLWKTAGITIRPWREDVIFGADQDSDGLAITITAEKAWKGSLLFDSPRHKTILKLPVDWSRINQFPEWFTVEESKDYLFASDQVVIRETPLFVHRSGKDLLRGITIELEAGETKHIGIQSFGSGEK